MRTKINTRTERKMMWEKTGPKTYKASNGSGFVADVDDMQSHFCVVQRGQLATVIVRGNSLDELKLALTEMAMRRAS